MAKQQNTFVTIVGILVVLAIIILVVKPAWLPFAITGSERMTRSFPTSVEPNSSFTVTYTVSSASGNWGVSVMDTLTCKDSAGVTVPSKTGMTQQFVHIYDSSGLMGTPSYTTTRTFVVPQVIAGTCTFTGDYKFGNYSIISFPLQTLKTKGNLCVSGFDANLDGTIDRSELATQITAWTLGSITRDKLGQAIIDWSNGC